MALVGMVSGTLSRRVRSQQCNPQSSSRESTLCSSLCLCTWRWLVIHVDQNSRQFQIYVCYFPYLENPSVRVSLNNGEILTARTMDIRRVRSPLILGLATLYRKI
ncbi:hypothetical protein M0802_006324 [Mischocyttarus mexicanus]|nr:hypothetical protein M0802_006324 [Mischocyttarus mexicanus]